MKYKVIGWTEYGNKEYPQNPRPCGNSAWNALVGELRQKGYRFGGDAHQYSDGGVPVLNDGTRLEYSMRTWGEAMAEAVYGSDPPPKAYMKFYMGVEGDCIMPRPYVDKTLISPAPALADTYEMKLAPEPFALVKSGKKTVEARLYDKKRSLLDVGDIIIFKCTGGEESLKVQIKDLVYADDFKELGKLCGLAPLGCGKGGTLGGFAKSMEKFYAPEKVDECGVLGIVFKLLKD